MADTVELKALLVDVLRAGERAMEIYARDFSVDVKSDASPVTEADLAVDEIIVSALLAKFPEIPVVTEERADSHSAEVTNGKFFLVDPIDGTKEFIKKTGEFTINIALIDQGTPVAGIVYAPALERMFLAEVGQTAVEIDRDGNSQQIKVRSCEATALIAVASRSHNTPETQAFLDTFQIEDCVSAGSSLKFCVVAAGEADIYPRFGPTMEWDTAAGDAVLRAAGGCVLNVDRTPFKYGKPDFRNPNFIASSLQAAKRCAL